MNKGSRNWLPLSDLTNTYLCLANRSDFSNIILAQKKPDAAVALQELFNLACLIDSLYGIMSGTQHNKTVGIRQLISRESCSRAIDTAMEEGKQAAIGAEHLA